MRHGDEQDQSTYCEHQTEADIGNILDAMADTFSTLVTRSILVNFIDR
jgi:hypothetical protein